MEQRHSVRQINKRQISKKRINRRKRLLRRLIRFGCRCMVLGLLAAVLIVTVKAYKRIGVPETDKLEEEGYPESLIALLEKNPETKDFVLNYHKNKDKHPEIDLSGEVTKGTVPLFLQWDERWGYEIYGSDFLAVTGCGPTCLAMVRCGLSGETEWNPLKTADMAEESGYYVAGAGSSWSLMTEGAAQMGLAADEVIFDADHIVAELENGRPVICIMGPGDFTTSGHFIVLSGVDGDGRIIVRDPNSKNNSNKTWDVDDLIPQIKNLWSYELSKTGGW